jgi:hypothetical protein
MSLTDNCRRRQAGVWGWDAEVTSRFERLRAKERGEAETLSQRQRQTRALSASTFPLSDVVGETESIRP